LLASLTVAYGEGELRSRSLSGVIQPKKAIKGCAFDLFYFFRLQKQAFDASK